MKLTTKINYNFISLAMLITFVGGMMFYVMLRKLVVDKVDGRLLENKILIDNNFESFLQNPNSFVWNEEMISLAMIEKKNSDYIRMTDTLIGNKILDNVVPFRKMEYQREFNGNAYRIKIFKELSFTDSLTLNIMMLLGFVVLFFILSFFMVFRFVAHSALGDFYDTVGKLKNFKVAESKTLQLSDSDVEEFEYLNNVLRLMTEKINNDYRNLKEFTENASHEIQTPLAIIQNKIELLIQDDKISDKQIESFSAILQATSRLSKLNHGLSQLVKIEGGHYVEISEIVITDLIDKNLDVLDEMLEAKNISVAKSYQSSQNIKINENLAELLIFNLLKNALKHNVDGGKIDIHMSGKNLRISNTGQGKAMDFEKLSKRFTKGNNSQSLGLGLAIVMKICLNYNIDITYNFENQMHNINLNFK